MTKLSIYGAALLALLLALALGAWWVYSKGRDAGQAQGEAQAVAAESQVAALTSTLKQVTADAAQAKQVSDAQHAIAQAAVDEATKQKSSNAQSIAQLQKLLDQAQAKPECAVLKEVLCDSVSDY